MFDINSLDTNKTHYRFLETFFNVFDEFIETEINKKKYTKLKNEFNSLYKIISNTRDYLEKNPTKREKIDGLILEMYLHLAEVREHCGSQSLMGISFIQQASKKFKLYKENK